MANQQLIQAALQAILDKEFNTWLLGIGSKGQELIKKLFLETAKKDQKLAAMAKEDPESTMILFAYQVYKLTKKSKDKSELESTEYETTEPEGEELEEMNYPPVSNPISAKFGAKLKHLAELNGHCPEGYEMRYFKKGGIVCGKCAKKKQLLMESMSCGGKKRVKKGLEGMTAPSNHGGARRNVKDPRLLVAPYTIYPMQVESQLQLNPKSTVVDTYSSRAAQRRRKLGEAYDRGLIDANKLNESLNASDSLYDQENQEYQNFPSLEEIRMIQDPVERKRMEEEFWKRHDARYLLYRRGGRTLTKAKAESLKYQGGPGDINSTEGMKPNNKQKKMLSRKVGGMVNNAKKITIYSQPDMIDYIKTT